MTLQWVGQDKFTRSVNMEALCEERRKIVEEHIDYAGRLANQFYGRRPNIDLGRDEYESAAFEGLCEAAKNFKPERGEKFSTFSYLRIRGSMYELIRKNTGVSRGYFGTLMGSDDKKENKLPYHFVNDARELSRMGVVLEEYGVNLHVSGDATKADISYSKVDSPEQETSKLETVALLKKFLNKLPKKQKKVIEYHYFHDLSYSEMSPLLGGGSKSSMSRLHSEGIKNLKKLIEREGVEFDLGQITKNKEAVAC